ncbi:hypothetical protein [Treponema pedis]|uniref:hypothetical protein n=1 Tax=Treponema pedis TaxID=409322 RepID=UPI0003FB0DB1|nr:hypothetical protein [Treponema pedis]
MQQTKKINCDKIKSVPPYFKQIRKGDVRIKTFFSGFDNPFKKVFIGEAINGSLYSELTVYLRVLHTRCKTSYYYAVCKQTA